MHSQIPSRDPGTEANEWVCVFVSPPMVINSYSRTYITPFFVISFLSLISLRTKQEEKKRNWK